MTGLPKYRRQKRPDGHEDLAFVVVRGKRLYLGAYQSPESREEYRRICSQLAGGQAVKESTRDQMSPVLLVDVIAGFWQHAETYYRRPDGTATSELGNFRVALRDVRREYGGRPVGEFGPLALRELRERWIEEGLARTTVNSRVRRVKQAMRWGVEHELVDPAVLQALEAVAGLRRGRSAARETDPIRPVPESHIQAIRPFVSRQIWGLVRIQILTAARPGEVIALRPCDLDRSGRIWSACLSHHKTRHHGVERTIYFGPRAQEELAPFLAGRQPCDAIFSPAEAEEERREAAERQRKTHASSGNRRGTNRVASPGRKPGAFYSTASYRRAVTRGIEKARKHAAKKREELIERGEDPRAIDDIPSWSPGQLRHNAATVIRREFGLEAARIILGHTSPAITEVYADRDAKLALEVAKRLG